MIEIKFTANNIADLHDQIRTMLPDHFTVPAIDKNTKGAIINTDGSSSQMQGNVPNNTLAGVNVNPNGSMTIPAEDKSGLGLDSVGHPWDERIHSTAKNKNNDGTWKIVRRPKRFDADPLKWKIYINDVLAELSGTPLEDSTAVPETENPEPQEDPADVFGKGQQTTTATSSSPVDLTGFLMFMTTNAGKITTEQVVAICQKHGVPELMVLYEPQYFNAVPVIFGEVEATINAHG